MCEQRLLKINELDKEYNDTKNALGDKTMEFESLSRKHDDLLIADENHKKQAMFLKEQVIEVEGVKHMIGDELVETKRNLTAAQQELQNSNKFAEQLNTQINTL